MSPVFILLKITVTEKPPPDDQRTSRSRSPVLRIRDVYPGSDFFPSLIPDPESNIFPHPGSESASQYFKPKHCFYALGNMTRDVHQKIKIRIRDPDLDFLSIPDRGVKKAPNLLRLRTYVLLYKANDLKINKFITEKYNESKNYHFREHSTAVFFRRKKGSEAKLYSL
jgi:hypothetical protein